MLSKAKLIPKQKKKSGQKQSLVGRTAYSGPYRLPSTNQADDVTIIQLNNYGSVATTAGGVLNQVIDAVVQSQSSADWSSVANLASEWQPLSMEVEFVPWNKYNVPTTNVLAPIISVTDRSDNTALSSLSSAIAYNSSEVHEPSTKFVRRLKMAGVDEANWVKISATPATTSRLYVKLYSGGNTASYTTHDYVARVMIAIRGRQ